MAARAGLSARCGAALVDADGRRYLVTYGDGFANVLQVPAPEAAVQRARRPALPHRRRTVVRREVGP